MTVMTMQSLKEIIQAKSFSKIHSYKYEFQVYGDRLAHELNDVSHLSLYMRLAKSADRKRLERDHARDREDQRTEENEERLMQRERDDAADHVAATQFITSSLLRRPRDAR